jgi:hypothetical protein
MLEFAFAVIEADSGYEYRYSDGLETKPKIPKLEDRKILLELICRAIAALVNESRAEEILCFTSAANLPDKALGKFLMIMDAFRQCGYDATEQEPFHGRRAWLIKRLT